MNVAIAIAPQGSQNSSVDKLNLRGRVDVELGVLTVPQTRPVEETELRTMKILRKDRETAPFADRQRFAGEFNDS